MEKWMISIPLLLNSEHDCSYLPHKRSQSAFVRPGFNLNVDIYGQLVEQGFRRSGDHVYATHCPKCVACIPVRIPVARFRPNRSQKRCWQHNADIQATIKPARFEAEHYDLYCRYQASRHTDGAMAKATPHEYMAFLSSSWCDTVFVEFKQQDELLAVAIVDRLPNALSAVYTFFEPTAAKRGLGTYAILWQIAHAKALNRPFVYLGFWIKDCQKMAYKSNYQPLQQRVHNRWVDLLD
jgi:leucyl-tRNA---protein transferase